jgi:predicted acetyltransferase
MVVRALVYEDTAVLQELLSFLRSQSDQIETIVLNTHEEDFHLFLYDPRSTGDLLQPTLYQESNSQGVGIMYRVIDVPRLFEVLRDHDFGGQTCRVKLVVADSFLPENAGEWVLAVSNGRAQLQPATADHEVVVQIDIAEFSSLITGAAEFKTLHRYGLAQISDTAYTQNIHDLFFTDNKPMCLTAF